MKILFYDKLTLILKPFQYCMQGFLVVAVGQAGLDMDLVDMGRDQGLDMEQVLDVSGMYHIL